MPGRSCLQRNGRSTPLGRRRSRARQQERYEKKPQMLSPRALHNGSPSQSRVTIRKDTTMLISRETANLMLDDAGILGQDREWILQDHDVVHFGYLVAA